MNEQMKEREKGQKKKRERKEKANEFWIDSISNGHDCLYMR